MIGRSVDTDQADNIWSSLTVCFGNVGSMFLTARDAQNNEQSCEGSREVEGTDLVPWICRFESTADTSEGDLKNYAPQNLENTVPVTERWIRAIHWRRSTAQPE